MEVSDVVVDDVLVASGEHFCNGFNYTFLLQGSNLSFGCATIAFVTVGGSPFKGQQKKLPNNLFLEFDYK